MSDVWPRLQGSNFVVGVGLSDHPFYVMLTLDLQPAGDFVVQVFFSPELTTLDGVETDVIVSWGKPEKLRAWVEGLVRDYSIQLAPEDSQNRLLDQIFRRGQERVLSPDLSNPWLSEGGQ